MFSPRLLLSIALLVLSGPAFLNCPAAAQSIKTITPPTYARFRTVNPSFIPNLAAIRQINIRTNHGAGLKNRLVKKHIKRMRCPKTTEPQYLRIDEGDDNSLASCYLPISFTSNSDSSYKGGPIAAIETKTAKAWARTFVAVTEHPEEKTNDTIFFAKDNQALVFSKLDHEFQIDGCKIAVKKGSLILLNKNSNGFALINLKDEHRDAVRIFLPSSKSISVKPGTEAGFESFGIMQKPKTDGFGRRNKVNHCSCGECKLNVCEVSIHSVLLNNRLTNSLYHSADKHERKLGTETLKTAAALAHMNKSELEYNWKSQWR